MWIRVDPIALIIGFPAAAALIIFLVRRAVVRSHERIARANSMENHARIRIEVAESQAVIARDQHRHIVAQATAAMNQTATAMEQSGQALHVSRKINDVDERLAGMQAQVDQIGAQMNTTAERLNLTAAQVEAFIGYVIQEQPQGKRRRLPENEEPPAEEHHDEMPPPPPAPPALVHEWECTE